MEIACLCPTDAFDYDTTIEQILQERNPYDIALRTFKPHHGDIPSSTEWDGVIVTGSEHHVYDGQEWVDDSEAFLLSALQQNIPTLGICYGHQLVAQTLGGAVEKLNEREMGYREISVTEEGQTSPLLEGINNTFVSFSSHLDHVAALPASTTVLAQNDYGIHAFRSKQYAAWGIQFHPEYSRGMADELLAQKELSEEKRNAIRSTFTEENVEAAQRSRTIFDNFVDHVYASGSST